jgi:outer membrane protein assembly factor BamD
MPKLRLLAIAVVLSVMGCASKDVAESNSAEAAFKSAEEYEKDERYEEAITKFSEVRNKHPYSKYAVEAELHIADIHYKKESFIEAQGAYQLFKDFHPKNPKIDYVTFRLAMSYFNQLPGTTDRDLTPALKAIPFFNEVLTSFGQSQYAKEAAEKKEECLRMLAEKEAYIGHFYFVRDMYDSAAKRYAGLLSAYRGKGYDEQALYEGGVSAFESGDKESGNRWLNELMSKYPNSSYISKSKKALLKYGSR